MSAPEAADAFVSAWRERARRRFGIINFANADMVGHTGVIEAAVRRSRPSTRASARSSRRCTSRAARCVITADHGNADHMLEPDGSPNTAHSLNPVPLIVTVAGPDAPRPGGSSPTSRRRVLALLGIEQPAGDDRPLADRAAS